MTKTIALSLALAASLGLTACSEATEENAANTVNTMAADANMAAENAMNDAGAMTSDAANMADNASNMMENAAENAM